MTEIDELKAPAYFLAGVSVYSAVRLGVVHGLSLERPDAILVDASKRCERWIGDYITYPQHRNVSEPVLRSLLAGAVSRRKAGAHDPDWDAALRRLESDRGMFKLGADAQKFCRDNWSKICLVAGTLQIDKVIPAPSLRRMLGLQELAA